MRKIQTMYFRECKLPSLISPKVPFDGTWHEPVKRSSNLPTHICLPWLLTHLLSHNYLHRPDYGGPFINRFCDMLDQNNIPFFLFYMANRWLAIFLDLMTVTIMGVTGFLIVFTVTDSTTSQAGLALTFAFQVCQFFVSLKHFYLTETLCWAIKRLWILHWIFYVGEVIKRLCILWHEMTFLMCKYRMAKISDFESTMIMFFVCVCVSKRCMSTCFHLWTRTLAYINTMCLLSH